MSSHPGVLRACVFPKSMLAKHVVLHFGQGRCFHSRFQQILSSKLCLAKNRKRTLLLSRRRAQNERPANLSVVAIYLRSQFGDNRISSFKLTFCRWFHSDDLTPT